MRVQMGEPYRTLLGHFRHEIGHYYWDRLIRGSSAPRGISHPVRRRAGGLRRGPATTLCRGTARRLAFPFRERLCVHASVGGLGRDVGALPAHRGHAGNRAGLQSVAAPVAQEAVATSSDLSLAARGIDFQSFDDLISGWIPLTVALNALNRSMGLSDGYPFVLSARAIDKLRFVHDAIGAGVPPRQDR